MVKTEDKKANLEKQFQDLLDKARELYPDIDRTIATFNNITAHTVELQDYLNLTMQTPYEISSNQITIA